jgi:hypothetical protein
LRLVSKFSFKPPDGIPLVQSCLEILPVFMGPCTGAERALWSLGLDVVETIAWPPPSHDLTPLDISVWGYVHNKVFDSPLSVCLEELRARITEAIATIDADMIYRIWKEIRVAYRWDICRVTRGNHIEQLCIYLNNT